MHFTPSIEISTPAGPALVDPAMVVMITGMAAPATVHLVSGHAFTAIDGARAVAERLWRFQNQADNGFFNASHVAGVVPSDGGGCDLALTGGHTLHVEATAEEFASLFREANATRNAMAGEP